MPWTVNPDHGYLDWRTTAGSMGALTNIDVDTSTPPGTDPVTPNGASNIAFNGAQVSSGTVGANVLRTASLAASSVTYQIQQSGSAAAQNTTLNGVAHFNSSHFTVANGFVSLASGGMGVDSFSTDVAGPVSPDGSGNIDVTGTNIYSNGSVANTITLNLQGTSNAIFIGQGSNTPSTTVGPLTNGQLLIGSTGVAPVAASLTQPAAGLTIAGGAGSVTFALADDLAALEGLATTGYAVRTAASTWATRTFQEGTGIDLTNASGVAGDTTIAVDVTELPTLATTFNSDSGSATPAANIITIAGGPGVTTSASGSTVTINSVTFTDQGSSTTIASDNGYFVTGNFNMTLPASPAQGEICIVYADTSSAVTVTGNTGQTIRIGSSVSASAGNAVSTAEGDCLVLRYRSSGASWKAISLIGNWILT